MRAAKTIALLAAACLVLCHLILLPTLVADSESSATTHETLPGPAAYAFIHIGKTGGTSVDSAMSGTGVAYVGHQHFDWSFLRQFYPAHRVLIVFRHPVSRAISQFHFSRKLPWTKGMAIRRYSLAEYLTDYREMLLTRGVWQDGEAGASWVAGTHIAGWVGKDARVSIDAREAFEQNTTAMCAIIERRLRSAFWIGFTETLSADMARLGARLKMPITVKRLNANSYSAAVDSKVRAKLTALTGLDHWLYANAKELAADRNYKFTACPRTLPCTSTRYTLRCHKSSPFGDVAVSYRSL